jgi:hypothetical protein
MELRLSSLNFLNDTKTGLLNKVLSILFRLKRHHSQRIIDSARNSLVTEFVPKHLGFEHISQEEFCQNQATLQHLLNIVHK